MRETFAQELAMDRIVQPSRRAAWMRQWDIGDAIFHARTADGIFQRDLSPETLDGETTEEKDYPRLEQRELLIEPRPAERDLSRRWPAISAAVERLSRKALRDRRSVRKVIFVDPRLGKPPPELCTGAATEWLADAHLYGAWGLAYDRDAVANRSRHDRPGALEISGIDAFRAHTNAGLKTLKGAPTVNRSEGHDLAL
jgi:hypothetical protein